MLFFFFFFLTSFLLLAELPANLISSCAGGIAAGTGLSVEAFIKPNDEGVGEANDVGVGVGGAAVGLERKSNPELGSDGCSVPSAVPTTSAGALSSDTLAVGLDRNENPLIARTQTRLYPRSRLRAQPAGITVVFESGLRVSKTQCDPDSP